MFYRRIPVLLLLVLFIFSCDRSNHYHHSARIPSIGWEMGKSFHFEDSLCAGASEDFHIELNLRHNTQYPYSNIWLYVRISTSEKVVRIDTVNWTLADASGHWLGTGWGSLYNITYKLPDLIMKDSSATRWFKIDIQNGLRDKVLTGVEDIGVRLFSD